MCGKTQGELIQTLIDSGCDMNEIHHGETPIMAANTHHLQDVIRPLLHRGAILSCHDTNKCKTSNTDQRYRVKILQNHPQFKSERPLGLYLAQPISEKHELGVLYQCISCDNRADLFILQQFVVNIYIYIYLFTVIYIVHFP